jgi:DNA-binding FadR family transcriptional regulator
MRGAGGDKRSDGEGRIDQPADGPDLPPLTGRLAAEHWHDAVVICSRKREAVFASGVCLSCEGIRRAVGTKFSGPCTERHAIQGREKFEREPAMAFPKGAPDPGDRIVRRKLSDQVLERLREMIRSGALKPGDAMPSERALMARFGVGRPAVREALQALHQAGLVSITQGERTRVNAMDATTFFEQSDEVARLLLNVSPANLQHLKEVRGMFELGVVRVAAERATVADIADLRAAVDRQRTMIGGDPRPFIEADIQFHMRIAAITANPIITAASQAMLRWLFEYHAALLHWSGKEEVTVAEHSDIVDQIAARAPDRAVEVMAAHLNRSRELYARVG